MRRLAHRGDLLLGLIALLLGVVPAVLTTREFRQPGVEVLDAPRRRVYILWALPAVIAPGLAVVALLVSARRGHRAPAALIVASLGLLVGIGGLYGLNALHRHADE